MSTLPKCFIEMVVTSGWGIVPLPSIVKPKPMDKILIQATVMNALMKLR